MKMKIIMIVSHFYPPITGGEIYNYKLYNYLKRKYEVEVISLYDTPYQFKGLFILRNLWFLKILLKKFRQLKNGEQIVIIEDMVRSSDLFLFNLLLNLFKKTLNWKVKTIALVHHTYTPLLNNKIKKMFKFICELIFIKSVDAIIVNSEFTKNEIKKFKIKRDILIAYPGLNISQQKIKSINQRSRNKEGLDLLFVGSVTSRKGVDTLIKSFKVLTKDYEIKNLTLHIVGDLKKEPDFSNKIKEYCNRERLNVKFYGRVDESKVNEFYRIADIFVFPSLWEGFGMVLIEAMYNKLPIVATNVGAIPYLVKDGVNGILVPPKDSKSLANAIKKLIESPKLRKRLGRNGYKFAKKFNWNKTFAKIESFIARC